MGCELLMNGLSLRYHFHFYFGKAPTIDAVRYAQDKPGATREFGCPSKIGPVASIHSEAYDGPWDLVNALFRLR
jgi:hypothetical protein